MKKIAILPPTFFPWIGVFEQIRAADTFVHLNDSRFSHGRSLANRAQINTAAGRLWLTAPVVCGGRQLLNDVTLDDTQAWQRDHLRVLAEQYATSPFAEEMLQLVREAYALPARYLAELNMTTTQNIASYFGLKCQFARASFFPSRVKGSQRAIELIKSLGGDVYISGCGLSRPDLRLFQLHGIGVETMQHADHPYTLHRGDFDPLVSILDVIAHRGRQGRSLMTARSAGCSVPLTTGRTGAHAA